MYSKDITWQQWIQADENLAVTILNAIKNGKDQYDKWTAFVYGKTDEQILALPAFAGKTQGDILWYVNTFIIDPYNKQTGNNYFITKQQTEGLLAVQKLVHDKQEG